MLHALLHQCLVISQELEMAGNFVEVFLVKRPEGKNRLRAARNLSMAGVSHDMMWNMFPVCSIDEFGKNCLILTFQTNFLLSICQPSIQMSWMCCSYAEKRFYCGVSHLSCYLSFTHFQRFIYDTNQFHLPAYSPTVHFWSSHSVNERT